MAAQIGDNVNDSMAANLPHYIGYAAWAKLWDVVYNFPARLSLVPPYTNRAYRHVPWRIDAWRHVWR